jgi:metal-dependent amidase/aminoacylase/carboxypeptidase family protein
VLAAADSYEIKIIGTGGHGAKPHDGNDPVRVVRDALLNIPERLAAMLASEGDERRVHQILATEIRAAMEELTDGAERG